MNMNSRRTKILAFFGIVTVSALLLFSSAFAHAKEGLSALTGLDSEGRPIPVILGERASPDNEFNPVDESLEVMQASFTNLSGLAMLSSADWFRQTHQNFMALIEGLKKMLYARIAESKPEVCQPWVEPPPLPVELTNRYEVAQLFRRLLGRAPAKIELDRYAGFVNTRKMTLPEVRKALRNTPEYKSRYPKKPGNENKTDNPEKMETGNPEIRPVENDNPGGGPKSGENDGRTGWFRVMTQNVRALPLMKPEFVKHDIELTAGQAGIIGWQEIGPDYYKNILEALPGDLWQTFWGEGHSRDRQFDSPISWKKTVWKKLDGGAWELHPPHAKISVRRFFTWVILEHRSSGAQLLVANKHYIAGAWNDEEKPFKELRPQMWRDGMKKEIAWLEGFMRKHPEMPIVLLGDYNANQSRDGREFPDRIGGRKLNFQVPPRSIDQIILINGGGLDPWRWEVNGEEGQTLVGRHSDHQGRRSVQRLSKTK